MDTNRNPGQKSKPFTVTSLEELRALYKEPKERTLKKETDHITPPGRKVIEASPMIMLATSGPDGADCSPKGDAPGFVQILDERTILIPDRPGNNRLDGMQNLFENPYVGIIFMVPGSNVTYRISGRAEISVDPELLAHFEVNGKLPRVVLVVHVEQAFSHCPKAFIRSDLWQAGADGPPEGVPSHGDFAKYVEGSTDDDYVEKFNENYKERLKKELY